MKLLRFLLQFLDPDREWFRSDKYQHGASFFIASFLGAALAQWTLPVTEWGAAVTSVAVCVILGFVYELGQTDTAYGAGLLGKPGFGISPLDLVWDAAGAIGGALLWLLL